MVGVTMASGNQPPSGWGYKAMVYWPVIVALAVVVLASGRADSAIKQNAKDIAALQAQYPVVIDRLGKIEGKLDVLLSRPAPP